MIIVFVSMVSMVCQFMKFVPRHGLSYAMKFLGTLVALSGTSVLIKYIWSSLLCYRLMFIVNIMVIFLNVMVHGLRPTQVMCYTWCFRVS